MNFQMIQPAHLISNLALKIMDVVYGCNYLRWIFIAWEQVRVPGTNGSWVGQAVGGLLNFVKKGSTYLSVVRTTAGRWHIKIVSHWGFLMVRRTLIKWLGLYFKLTPCSTQSTWKMWSTDGNRLLRVKSPWPCKSLTDTCCIMWWISTNRRQPKRMA